MNAFYFVNKSAVSLAKIGLFLSIYSGCFMSIPLYIDVNFYTTSNLLVRNHLIMSFYQNFLSF